MILPMAIREGDAHSPRQRGFWWEVDATDYGLRLLAALGVVGNLRPVTERARTRNLEGRS